MNPAAKAADSTWLVEQRGDDVRSNIHLQTVKPSLEVEKQPGELVRDVAIF